MKHEVTSLNTKKMLAATLKTLLQQKSLSKISVSEIVSTCHINRKTFYYHFTDIYDLLEWHLEQEMLETLNTFSPVDSLHESFNFSLDYLEQNTYLANCVSDPIGYDRLTQYFNKKFYPMAFDFISQSEQTYGKTLPDDYKAFLANLYARVSALSLIDMIKNKSSLDREQVILYVSDILFGSLEGIFHKL